MKNIMLALVFGFGFASVGGCGVEGDALDENDPGIGEQTQALTTYNGKCQVVNNAHNGYCRVTVGICAKALSSACQGTPVVAPTSYQACGTIRPERLDSTPCTITQ